MILSVLPVDSAVKTTLLETSHSIILHDVPRSSDQHRLRTKGMKRNYLVEIFTFLVWGGGKSRQKLENPSACSVKPAIGAPLGHDSELSGATLRLVRSYIDIRSMRALYVAIVGMSKPIVDLFDY